MTTEERRRDLRRRQLMARQATAKQAPQTNMIEQSMSGVNEGLASLAGAPVDLMTGALNLGSRGINAVAGTDIPQIENPAGGSGTFRDILAPTISDVEPQNTAQRFGRRIGQDLGAAVIPGGAVMRAAQAPMKVAGGTMLAATGSGAGGQTAREIAPDSDLADFAGSMIGGGGVVAAVRALRTPPKAPTLQQLMAERDAGYDAVRQSNATLSPQSSDALATSIEGTFGTRPATRRLNPKAAIAGDELSGDLRSNPPSISEIDETRQWIGQNVAGSREAGERAIGVKMKGAIDQHLDGLQPQDVTGTNHAEDVVAALKGAREKSHRIHKSQLFEAEDTGEFSKGLRRAATSGTGGNEVNAIRQNIRRVLENPKLRRGFNEDELQAMRDIADGTPTQNAMRLIGRLAPTSGALPLGAGAGGAGITASTGNPLFMAPSAAGLVAKALSERSTRKQVNNLGELIRNGAPLPKKGMSDIENRIVAALLASQAGQRVPEPNAAHAGVADILAR